MIWASFIAIGERFNPEFLQDFERLKYSSHDFLCQQACYDVAI